MVHRAQRPDIGVGGHISTYASSATLYEVGFNHFFRGKDDAGGGDQVFIQGHASPGIYARAFLEGRLSEEQLDGFRQEKSHPSGGLPSYPHPRLMPDFWEFPTVSMGLGPINAIYQAQFNKYLHGRGIKDTSSQQRSGPSSATARWTSRRAAARCSSPPTRSWTTSPSSSTATCSAWTARSAATARSSRNWRRSSAGAGWNVIKVIWGREWDTLLAADRDQALVNVMNQTRDGDYQTFRAEDGAYIREHFFGRDPAHPQARRVR